MVLFYQIIFIIIIHILFAIVPYCEYSFEDRIFTIEELINLSIEEKNKYYSKQRLMRCYELKIIDNRCLDYRDICDGEFYCYLIEINK